MSQENVSIGRDLLPSGKARLASVQIEGPFMEGWLPRRPIDNNPTNGHVDLVLQVMHIWTPLTYLAKEPLLGLSGIYPHLVKSRPLLLVENGVEGYIVVPRNEYYLLEVFRTFFEKV